MSFVEIRVDLREALKEKLRKQDFKARDDYIGLSRQCQHFSRKFKGLEEKASLLISSTFISHLLAEI